MVTTHRRSWVQPLLSDDVLPPVPTKMRMQYLCALLVVPCVMVIFCFIVIVHDLSTDGRALLAEEDLAKCWKSLPSWSRASVPGWGGMFVQWLSRDPDTGVPDCSKTPHPKAVWAYGIVLPIAWLTTIGNAWKVWRLTTKSGAIGVCHRSFISKVKNSRVDDTDLAEGFVSDVAKTREAHKWYLFYFQAMLFFVDYFVMEATMRWIIWYQFAWLGFSSCILQVRPAVIYASLLSQAMVDYYTRELVAWAQGKEIDDNSTCSWIDWAGMHRCLELDISNLWREVNTTVFLPIMPFLVFGILHVTTDGEFVRGSIVATVLVVLGCLMLSSLLSPIARISSMFNSQSAFRAETGQMKTRGRTSIAAVARKLAIQDKSRTAEESQEYGIFLEYVLSHKVRVVLGFRGLFFIGVDQRFVVRFFWEFAFKLPLVVSFFIALRSRI